MGDEFDEAMDGVRDMMMRYEGHYKSRYEEIEKARAKIRLKLNIPENISWGGFEYYETDIFNSDAPVDPKEFFRFFWKNDPEVTFDAQIALNGEKYLRPGRYDSGRPPRGKNTSEEEDIAYLSECAHEVLAVAEAGGCKNVEMNPQLLSEEEKQNRARQAAEYRVSLIDGTPEKEICDILDSLGKTLGYQGPPISYIELSANADTLRALAKLDAVASIELIRRPSNLPPKNNAWANHVDETLRDYLPRDDKHSLDPAP